MEIFVTNFSASVKGNAKIFGLLHCMMICTVLSLFRIVAYPLLFTVDGWVGVFLAWHSMQHLVFIHLNTKIRLYFLLLWKWEVYTLMMVMLYWNLLIFILTNQGSWHYLAQVLTCNWKLYFLRICYSHCYTLWILLFLLIYCRLDIQFIWPLRGQFSPI